MSLVYAILTQTLPFLPLAFAVSISYTLMKAADMTLDGSFVLGAGVFAHAVSLGFSPSVAAMLSVGCGALAGVMVSCIQRQGRIDPLLAGILATFILTSVNLLAMGRPNISLLSEPTLVSGAFAHSNLAGNFLVALYSLGGCFLACLVTQSRWGLLLRGLGDNPKLLERLGHPVERYRLSGFAMTNAMAAFSGLLTAQTVGYADISMGFGMTLTGIGAIILGQQLLRLVVKRAPLRTLAEFFACVLGVFIYFFAVNFLLRFDVDPILLKMMLGIMLVLFLRTATHGSKIHVEN